MVSISACTASATVTVLLSGCRNTFSSTAFFVLAVTAVYTGLTDGDTVAMSPTRIGAPSGVVLTTMLPMSSSVRAWPLTRLSTSWWLFSNRPGESIRLLRPIASSSAGTVICVCSSFAGSACTSNSGSWPPCTTIVDTPVIRLSRGLRS